MKEILQKKREEKKQRQEAELKELEGMEAQRTKTDQAMFKEELL